MDEMETMATCALYGLQNKEIVEQHFDGFISDMLSHFDDGSYLNKIKSLKARCKMSGGIKLPKGDEVFCFTNKIWYSIERSSSQYREYYGLNIGINLSSGTLSPFDVSKIYLKRAAYGELDYIIEKIHQPDFADDIKKRLCEWVYDSCNESAIRFFSPKSE